VVRRLLLIAVLLIVPATSYAQDATLSGTVKDTSGGVLPGVTVTALHEATGNTFVAVTDGVGAFRLPVRTGSYRITVELMRQTVTAYGEQVPLQPGMQLEADVTLETRRLYEWVLEPLYTITGKWQG